MHPQRFYASDAFSEVPAAADPLALSLNENPYPPLPAVKAALIRSIDAANRYPEFLPQRMRGLIADRIGVPDEQIILGAGATGVMLHVLNVITDPGDRIVITDPTFEGYPIVAGMTGVVPVQVPLDPTGHHDLAAMTRNGVTIKEAKDFVGKKVGAPGIGAYLQVLFIKWLMEKGVDPKSVNFVEVTFPTMSDALKSGSVDAVLTAEPFVTRITKAGTGEVGVRYGAELAGDHPVISNVATRAFAEANPEVIKNFRAAITEAAAIVNGDRDKASASIAKFTKLPLEIVKLNRPSLSQPALKGSDYAWWVETMKQQDMLQTDIDVNKLVLP